MLKNLAAGLVSYVPGSARFVSPRAREAASPRYCYSVWLRHLVLAVPRAIPEIPRVVAELGPGDSLGVGLAALLSSVEIYRAFDVVEHASLARNLTVFDEMVPLFRARAAIPGPDEFPEVGPTLDDYRFPFEILTDERLDAALAPERLERIRASLLDIAREDSCIRYDAPWYGEAAIRPGTIDMAFSQAVLEHVVDLPATYRALHAWLKPGGLMSHKIDYRCHGIDRRRWNAHWTYSDLTWKLLQGRRPYLLNRQPHSAHLACLRQSGFELVLDRPTRQPSPVPRSGLAPRFRDLGDDDLSTSGTFIQARKPA